MRVLEVKTMDLEKYHALLLVLHTGSLSTAASRLGYTPSGISRMISSLEEECHFPLLYRKRDGVEATPALKELLPEIEDLLYREERFKQHAAKISGLAIGHVVVGTAYNSFYKDIAESIAAFHHLYPHIHIEMRPGYSTALLHKMEHHELDFCFISKREGKHQWQSLFEDPIMAWVPVQSDYAKKDSFSLESLKEAPYIDMYPGQDVDHARLLKHYHITPHTQFSTMDSSAAEAMVNAGLGICINNAINSHSISEGIKLLPLDPPQSVELGIAYLEDLSPAAKTFIKFIHERIELKKLMH